MNLRLYVFRSPSVILLAGPLGHGAMTLGGDGNRNGDRPRRQDRCLGIRMRPPQCGRRALALLAALLEGEG